MKDWLLEQVHKDLLSAEEHEVANKNRYKHVK